jgi:hypothetical protein
VGRLKDRIFRLMVALGALGLLVAVMGAGKKW